MSQQQEQQPRRRVDREEYGWVVRNPVQIALLHPKKVKKCSIMLYLVPELNELFETSRRPATAKQTFNNWWARNWDKEEYVDIARKQQTPPAAAAAAAAAANDGTTGSAASGASIGGNVNGTPLNFAGTFGLPGDVNVGSVGSVASAEDSRALLASAVAEAQHGKLALLKKKETQTQSIHEERMRVIDNREKQLHEEGKEHMEAYEKITDVGERLLPLLGQHE